MEAKIYCVLAGREGAEATQIRIEADEIEKGELTGSGEMVFKRGGEVVGRVDKSLIVAWWIPPERT